MHQSSLTQQGVFCAIDYDFLCCTLTNTLSHSCSLGKCLLTRTLSNSCRVSTTAGSGFLKLTQALFTPSDPILTLASACCNRSSGMVSIAYADKPSSSSLTSVDQTSSLRFDAADGIQVMDSALNPKPNTQATHFLQWCPLTAL